jgi:hypothetical protein
MRAQKSPLAGINRLARKADRSVRTILRLVAVIAALVGGAVYWNFGALSPCGVIREVIRQRSDMADIIPDAFIDFGFETQFGEMSANRCFAVLLEKPNFAGADRRAIPITVDATARAATRNAKVVAKRCQNSSIRTLSADLEVLHARVADVRFNDRPHRFDSQPRQPSASPPRRSP